MNILRIAEIFPECLYLREVRKKKECVDTHVKFRYNKVNQFILFVVIVSMAMILYENNILKSLLMFLLLS